MRLVARSQALGWLEEGDVVAGYVVEKPPDRRWHQELRYTMRAPDGRAATLVTARSPHGSRRARARFRELARLRVALDHPGFLLGHTFGEHADRPYLITDEHPDRMLGDLLTEEAPLEPEHVVTILGPVAEGLDLANGAGLFHHAFEADSLLVARGDRLMFGSFGVVTTEASEVGVGLTQVGDLRYRSPEELRGEPLAAPANVYSFTALLVHLLTGQPPFMVERAALSYAHAYQPPPRLSERMPSLGSDLDSVVAGGLSKDPADRPQSAQAVLDAAAAALGVELPPRPEFRPPRALIEGAPPRSPKRRATPRASLVRPPRIVAASAVAAAILGAALAVATDPFGDAPSAAPRPAGSSELTRLAAQRSDLRAALAEADTPQEQAEAAGRLAAAYEDAADAVPAGPRARDLDGASDAYSDLADAAEAGSQEDYAAASTAVADAERRLLAGP